MKKYALIGNNIQYSLSPSIYKYWLDDYNIKDTLYDLVDTTTLNEKLITKLLDNGYLGFNLTQPFKAEIFNLNLPLHTNDIAKQTQSINILSWIKRELYAYNTDYLGILDSLKHFKVDILNKNILILGAGAMAKCVIHALQNKAKVIVYNKTVEKISALRVISYLDYNKQNQGNIDIIINATSVCVEEVLINSNLSHILDLSKTKVLFDLNYRFDNSSCKYILKNENLLIYDGLYMLLAQGMYNFEIWFGIKPKIDNNIINFIKK